jgi:hypothetical protein
MPGEQTISSPRPANCGSCNAPILWITTANGKNAPVDRKPEKRYVLRDAAPGIGDVLDTYISHFATCPFADEHRKPAPPRLPGILPEWRGALEREG